MNVIEVRGLSKKYRIGKAEKRADTIMGAIANGLKSPLQNLRQIRNLSKLDRDEDSVFWALRDVSFEVKQGEVLGIIGHNGAGKSTLLKILSRITEPSAGEVHITGRVAALLEVGTGFHPELTGRENIYMNGTILGMRKKEIDKKLNEIVDFSGVEKYLDTPVKFYSSGMRVRLGFSVAAHLDPEILIIDEVLAVGDADFQNRCLGKMNEVAQGGKTVLFVSHQMGAVSKLTNTCLWLDKGCVYDYGTSNEIVQRYLSFNNSKNRAISNLSKVFREQRIFLNNKDMIDTRVSINFSENLEILFEGISLLNIKHVAFFYRIESLHGEILCTFNSKDNDIYYDLNEGFLFSVSHRILIPNIFLPGMYYITIALQESNGNVIEAQYQVANFEVNAIGVPDRLFSQKSSQGVFYLNGKWN